MVDENEKFISNFRKLKGNNEELLEVKDGKLNGKLMVKKHWIAHIGICQLKSIGHLCRKSLHCCQQM